MCREVAVLVVSHSLSTAHSTVLVGRATPLVGWATVLVGRATVVGWGRSPGWPGHSGWVGPHPWLGGPQSWLGGAAVLVGRATPLVGRGHSPGWVGPHPWLGGATVLVSGITLPGRPSQCFMCRALTEGISPDNTCTSPSWFERPCEKSCLKVTIFLWVLMFEILRIGSKMQNFAHANKSFTSL